MPYNIHLSLTEEEIDYLVDCVFTFADSSVGSEDEALTALTEGVYQKVDAAIRAAKGASYNHPLEVGSAYFAKDTENYCGTCESHQCDCHECGRPLDEWGKCMAHYWEAQ